MSNKVQFIYGFNYKFNGVTREEFFKTKSEAIEQQELNARLASYIDSMDSVKITDVTEVRTIPVWHGLHTEETV